MRYWVYLGIGGTLASALCGQVPDFTPQTPLIGAILHNNRAEAKRLLKSGANPNEGSFAGFSPLLLAITRQDVELLRLMVDKGADLKARDKSGSPAIMWAAFNETGDATMIEELLRLGADPFAVNRAGEDALAWALRRGETAAVVALRNAGLSETASVRKAVAKAVALMEKSGPEFVRVSGCVSCHHQSVPQMAYAEARASGIATNAAVSRQQAEATMALLKTVYEPALKNRDRLPNPPFSLSYALLGLAAESWPRDEVTAAIAKVVAAWQENDGAFRSLPPVRPPIESSEFAATALSLRALQVFGNAEDHDRVERAAAWLRSAEAVTTEDRAMKVLGLSWAHAPKDQVRRAADALIATQQRDGGWSQLATTETDAYATGQALVALWNAGHRSGDPAFRRGVGYLLRTQFPDGSWLVRSRTYPVQPLKESGFPHGIHQWISATGTGWAAMALALSLRS